MTALSAEEMVKLWQQHIFAELVQRDTEAALATMTEDAHVLVIPSGRGGWGKEGVRRFYADSFIPSIPPDISAVLLSQTVGGDRLIEETIYRFTHSIAMDWMFPGIPATHRPVELALVNIIQFRDGKIASEHLYWDQAFALVQLGVIPADTPGIGAGEANRRLGGLVDAQR